MTVTVTPTLIRTRRRPRREPATEPAVALRVVTGLAANDPPMLAVADQGRGWWPVGYGDQEVTVRRHGEELRVPWSQVVLDV